MGHDMAFHHHRHAPGGSDTLVCVADNAQLHATSCYMVCLGCEYGCRLLLQHCGSVEAETGATCDYPDSMNVCDWLFVFPLCGFSLSLFCNYPDPMNVKCGQ